MTAPLTPERLAELRAEANACDRLALRCAGTKATEAEKRAYTITAGMLAQSIPSLLTENDALRAVLREVEWSGRAMVPSRSGPPYEVVGCPSCRGEARPDSAFRDQLVGHAPGCRLDALLRGVP